MRGKKGEGVKRRRSCSWLFFLRGQIIIFRAEGPVALVGSGSASTADRGHIIEVSLKSGVQVCFFRLLQHDAECTTNPMLVTDMNCCGRETLQLLARLEAFQVMLCCWSVSLCLNLCCSRSSPQGGKMPKENKLVIFWIIAFFCSLIPFDCKSLKCPIHWILPYCGGYAPLPPRRDSHYPNLHPNSPPLQDTRSLLILLRHASNSWMNIDKPSASYKQAICRWFMMSLASNLVIAASRRRPRQGIYLPNIDLAFHPVIGEYLFCYVRW